MCSEWLVPECNYLRSKKTQQEINPNERGLDGGQDYPINRPSLLLPFNTAGGQEKPMFPVLMGLVEGIKTYYKE